MDPFQLCKIKKGHLSFSKIIAKWFLLDKICRFWPASSVHANNGPLFVRTCTVAGSFVSLTECQAFGPPSPQIPQMIQRGASFWLYWKCIVWIIEFFGSYQESTNMYIFGNDMMRLWRLSIILEFFNSFHVLLVLVTPRLANCDSLMELGQNSTPAHYSRFPEACLKRRNSCALKYSECNIWSFRGASCLANNFLLHFLLHFWQRILPA